MVAQLHALHAQQNKYLLSLRTFLEGTLYDTALSVFFSEL